MPRLTDVDALLKDITHRYCENCERRKGTKNGKQKFIYDIGEVPCRACEVDDMKYELESAPTVDAVPVMKMADFIDIQETINAVGLTTDAINFNPIKYVDAQGNELVPVRHGHWIGKEDQKWHCSECDGIAPKGYRYNYCPYCGAKMDEVEDEDS